MHGGPVNETFSWTSPPGAHLLRSPDSGRPRKSTFCPVLPAAAAAVAVPAAGADAPVELPDRTALPVRADAPPVGDTVGPPVSTGPSAATDPESVPPATGPDVA